MRLRGPFILICALALSWSAIAGEVRFLSQKGQWIINKAETKIPAGGFTPPDAPMVVTDDDGTALKITLYMMTNTGLQPAIAFDGAYDGMPHSYGNDATRSFTHLSPNSFRSEWKGTNGQSGSEVATFSADNKKIQIVGKAVDKSGKAYDYVQVWDRLQ